MQSVIRYTHAVHVLKQLRSVDPFTGVLLPLLAFAVLWKGGKSLETTWLLTAAAWVMTVQMWRKGREQPGPIPAAVWATLMGFVAWTVLAMIASSTPNYGLDEVLRTGSFALIFAVCVRRAMHSDETAQRFAVTLTLAAGVAALIGILVYVNQPVNRFVGTFFDHRFHTDYWPNAWAQCVLLSWPVAVWWAMRGDSMRSRRTGMLLAGVLLGGLLLSYSRGAMIAFGGQALLGALMLVPRKPPVKFAVQWVAALACAAVAIFLVVNAVRARTYPVESVTAKVTFTADEGGSSVSERRAFWNDAVMMASERPLFGWGPYSFRFVQPQYQDGVLATSDHPHNVLLKYAAERGWPAVLLFLGFLLAVAVAVVPRLFRADPLPMAFVLGVAGVFAHNMIDFNLQFVGIALPWWMMLGLLTGIVLRNQKSKNLNTKFVRITEVLLSTLVVCIAVVETPPMILSSLGRHSEAAGNLPAALQWYDAAGSQILSRDMALARTQILIKLNRLEEAKTAIDDFQKMNAEDPRAWSLKSDVAQALEDDADALAAQNEAWRRNKWNDIGVTARLIRLRQHAGEDMTPDGDAYLRLLRSFADAIDHNLHFIALGPNPEAFQEASAALADVVPAAEPELQVLAARVMRRAEEEREKLSARPPGRLW